LYVKNYHNVKFNLKDIINQIRFEIIVQLNKGNFKDFFANFLEIMIQSEVQRFSIVMRKLRTKRAFGSFFKKTRARQ
jgi:sugar-specific transcriptional regulator TrmB